MGQYRRIFRTPRISLRTISKANSDEACRRGFRMRLKEAMVKSDAGHTHTHTGRRLLAPHTHPSISYRKYDN